MLKYKKKPVVIEAQRWWRNGDHPYDVLGSIYTSPGEGHVVRYFRRPSVPSESRCQECGYKFHDHGWIDTLEDGHKVCPGDWIITGIEGERYPCKPGIFKETYDSAEE